MRDVLADFFRRAHLSVAVEKGHGLTRDHNRQRPADLLVTGWDRGRPAAMDITVTSPLTPVISLGGVMPSGWCCSTCSRESEVAGQ